LLAGFQVLLARYSGQTDIVVGTPIANRTRKEVEGLIGPFINTLVLRVDLSNNPDVRELLANVKRLTLEAYLHQDLPFDKLVEVLNPQRSLSHHPLFEVLFALHNVPSQPVTLPGVQVRLVNVETHVAHFDLMLNFYEDSDGLLGDIEYDQDLFEPETIERLSRHYQQLLTAMTSHPQMRALTLPLLTETELTQLQVWNATEKEYPYASCLPEVFEQQVERTAEAVALVFEGQHLTYDELNARANQLAGYLHQLGVRQETLVGLCLDRSIAQVVGMLGILKAGGAYVPLDPSYPQERIAFMLQDAQIHVLLTQAHLQARFSGLDVVVLCLDRDWLTSAQQNYEAPPQDMGAASLAYVIYTSGSTGVPKGVQVQQGSVLRLVCDVDYVRLDERQHLLQMAPVSFDAATFELWAPLLHGGRCVLFAGELPSIEAIKEVLHREQVSTLWLTASLFNVVIDEAPEALAGLQQLLIGGEALSVPHVRRGLELLPGVQIINGYGPTENTTFSCCEPITSPVPADIRSIPIGRPIANTQAYVLDALRQPVPVGVIGELYLGGAGLARGYLQRPELTAERFVPHPWAGEPGERLYRTGDLVRWLPDGRLEFVGRCDGQVKLRGFRIELEEIEAALLKHEAVREAVVLLQEDAEHDKRLVAYIVPRSEKQAPDAAELRHWLSEQLPDYMLPATFMLLDCLPLTPNGKLDYHALPTPQSRAASVQAGYVSPGTELEKQLVAIWAGVLKLDRVGIHDNFFELGGHSLLATQIISRVRASFQIALPLRSLFQAPTIAALAQEIEEHQVKQGTVQLTVIQRAERDDGEQILEHLEHLSDEEIDALFDMMVTEKEVDR